MTFGVLNHRPRTGLLNRKVDGLDGIMFKDMTVGKLKKLLEAWPDERSICMTSRIQYGTAITAINFLGEDKHGNLVITLDDSLLRPAAERRRAEDAALEDGFWNGTDNPIS